MLCLQVLSSADTTKRLLKNGRRYVALLEEHAALALLARRSGRGGSSKFYVQLCKVSTELQAAA